MKLRSLLQVPMRFLVRLWKSLTEPFESLPRAEDRRRAIITSAFLLFSAGAVELEQMIGGNTPFIALLLLIVGYFLARTRWFRIATFILLTSLTFPSYLVALTISNPNPDHIIGAFAWVMIPLLLSSLIYSVRTTIIISTINLVSLCLLPYIHPELDYRVMGGTIGFFGLASAILVIVMVQRNEIEKDRQTELMESREKLSREVSERERFAEQAQRRADQLSMLNEVGRAISSLQDLNTILDVIFEQMKHNFRLDVFFVALYNEKTGILSFPITFDNKKRWQEPDKELAKASRTAQVIESGKPLLWNRSTEEIEESARLGNRIGDQSRVAASILISPLQAGRKTIGVISVQSYEMNAYNNEHLSLLTALAQQIVVAIENARLYEETKQKAQQLSILNEISQAVAALKDLPELLEVVFTQAQQKLNIDTFFVGLYDSEKNEVTYPILYDDGQRYNSAPGELSEESFLYQLLHGEKAKLINRTAEKLATISASSGMVGNTSKLSASLLIVPLTIGDQVIGVFSAQSYTLNAYDESDFNLFVRIASHVSIAIENSRLYAAAQQEITERQKVEEQLRSAETQYRELVERVPAVIYNSETGPSGQWFYVSPQIKTLLGYTTDEWLADPNLWYERIHPDDREHAVTAEAQALATNNQVEMEYRMYAKDGRLLWIHDESISVSISNNQETIVQGFLMDVTIRKQAEQTLRESEEKYHSLFITAERQTQELTLLSEVQGALARELDLSELIHTVVEAIAKTFGYTFVSLYLLEKGCLRLQHQVGYETVIETIPLKTGVSGQVVETGESVLIKNVAMEPGFLRASDKVQSEVSVPLFDGDEIFGVLNVESSKEHQLNEDDLRLMNTLSEQINIAIRRTRLYAERAESLRREQHINEFAHAISSTLDLPGILEKVTRLSVELIGADTGTISIMSDDGMQMTNVYYFNDDTSLDKIIPKGHGLTWLTYEKGRPLIVDEYSEHPNAMPEWSASGLHGFMGVPIIAGEKQLGALSMYNRDPEKKFTPRDLSLIEAIAHETAVAIQNARLFDALQKELTEHKQTQDQLQVLVHELEAKNAELERFTYSVSHDLKSPLVTIGGFLGFLEADAKAGDIQKMEKTIQRIREATKKMQRLLNEVLELSRIGRIINPPVEVSFAELVSEAVELTQGQLQERQVEVRVEAGLPIVNVDRVRMIEVLQNLIVNAIKFMGGQKNPVIEIGVKNGNGDQIFYVKDNGVGIAPEYHTKIFGLFDKLDPRSDGTGIGLALVKRIIEVHGGTIWVDSEVGKGTTFFFTLGKKINKETL